MMSSATNRRARARFQPARVETCEERVLLSGLALHSHHLTAGSIHSAVARTHHVQHHGTAPKTHLASATSTAPGFAHPLLVRKAEVVPSRGKGGGGGPPPSALTPAQMRHIYGFDQISNLGDNQKIAIVDAFDDPNIFSDADVFDKQFNTQLNGSTSYYSAYGASSTWLTKVYASGSKPPGDTGWGQEISLDVEWAHAIAPKAKIILVEAASNSYSDLLAANDQAVAQGATVISNSWGSSEFSGETGYDSHFAASGVTFVFSSGDSGNQSYPALSPNVVSVGGTTLSHDSSFNWSGEAGWSGSGGGVSSFESKPSYQSSLTYSNRANPDVAYDADPNTGVAVYDSYGANRFNPAWAQFGGTSAGAPQWAGLLALANQGRLAGGKSVLDGVTQTLPALYAMTSDANGTQLFDVITGANSVGSAGPHYDLVTGQGTPRKALNTYNYLVTNVS